MCGERAVRVDILERLADLIRPALAWREGAPGTKPPGAVAGGGFTVVNAMTSLIGASGEDFASILRSLGYRMERRPKPPEPLRAADSRRATAVASRRHRRATLDAALGVVYEAAVPAHAAERRPTWQMRLCRRTFRRARETTPSRSPAVEANPICNRPQNRQRPRKSLHAQLPNRRRSRSNCGRPWRRRIASRAGAMPAEPEMIEVWRPGRTEGRRRAPRPRHTAGAQASAQRNRILRRRRTPRKPAMRANADNRFAGRQPMVGHAKDAHRQSNSSAPAAPQAGASRPDRQQRERDRPRASGTRDGEQRKRPDPNSPFAKLAGLKAQLEADAKERR